METIKLTLLEVTVLSALSGGDEKYGWQIKKELDQTVRLGSLYNILKQLEKKGLISSEWGSEEIVQGARRRYYTIKAEGENSLIEVSRLLADQKGLRLEYVM